MSAHRTPRVLALGAAAISILLSSPPISAAAADPAPSDSTVTVTGTGEFANLKVTVGQTKNLINQAVTLSWTGGHPTLPSSGDFGVNYLQIMQCWGDDQKNGPDRTQCQYGGSSSGSTNNGGSFVRSRQINYGNLVDPKEKLKQATGSFDNAYVPFWAVGTDQPTGPATVNENDFFDSQVTNEIPLGSTHGDGSGQVFFEVETVRQAAGLGCGEPLTTGGVIQGRSCWLVIVPRGTTEVDGSTRSGSGFNRLDSSPLSQTNWDNRLVVPLDFQPVGQSCPIGASERRLIGHELAADAVNSWQPALCTGGGALYGYTQLTDDVIRNQVLDGSTPGLALLTNPIPPEQAPADHSLIYAPVGLSGLTIAFNVEHQPLGSDPPAALALDGQRFLSMKLTPRLVAKLLTQSYLGALVHPPDKMKNNPLALTVDPEFLDLNPEYKGFANFNRPADALVQLDGSDLTSLLWSWVKVDPDASAFIAGVPDAGMVVNPANQGLALPVSTFPRNDQSCVEQIIGGSDIKGKICTLDGHPFTKDMHDSGRSASRGDSQARTTGLAFDQTPTSKKLDPQDAGHRALLAVVDTATASRYGLPTAALRNAAGKYVTPTAESMLAGENAMKPSAVAGVLASDPGAADQAAYPLTALSYAVTAPSTLDAAAGKDYAAFLRYAASAGQQPGLAPGKLPLGMVPLPDALKAQTTAAAATVEAQAGKSAPPGPAEQPTSTAIVPGGAAGNPARSTSGSSNTAAGTGATTTNPGARANPPPAGVATQPARGSVTKTPSVPQKPVARALRTPSLPGPAWLGALLLIVLIGGALAGASPPAMHLLRSSSPVIYLLGAAARRRARREVTPTER